MLAQRIGMADSIDARLHLAKQRTRVSLVLVAVGRGLTEASPAPCRGWRSLLYLGTLFL